jgi:prepilin-type N-terminal cleavage/methylation domain-containing protein
MKILKSKSSAGFSLIELLISMTLILILLGVVSNLLARSLSVRSRESSKADALASAQAALNVLSREVGNSGFGISTTADEKEPNNGIVTGDSNATRIHIRSNVENVGTIVDPNVLRTNLPGEDVVYFYDATTKSIVRYDRNDSPTTSVVVNKISNVTFTYWDYTGSSSTGTSSATPTANTGRIQITVAVTLDPVYGQPNPSSISFTSDVTLRNSKYMLNQY